MCDELYIIIVLFKPSPEQVANLIKLSLCYRVIAVDNTPFVELPGSQSESFDAYIALKKNKGIAYAQNIGICEVQKKCGKYVLFFDQDSDMELDFPAKLLEAIKDVELKNRRVVALGPAIYNKITRQPYKGYKGVSKIDDKNIICPTLISSGTISPIWAFEEVGMMNESLFIDFVDHEWCWRAKKRGYFCCMNNELQLLHQVGQKDVKILGYPFLLAAPFRYYYQYRNACWLQKVSYVPKNWKLKAFIRNFIGFLCLPWFTVSPFMTIRYMLKGLWEGLVFKMKKNEAADK